MNGGLLYRKVGWPFLHLGIVCFKPVDMYPKAVDVYP